ncbi:MAG: T9SS type A sorting domain-containing protein [Flavobacteriales bacterium]|nr:T9SS type A sorting domain-containing protein [Flavobacteriales bacterium]MCC6939195.1 T9SS type A sorting domain-containing protein [Flavobacteriales bacterium]
MNFLLQAWVPTLLISATLFNPGSANAQPTIDQELSVGSDHSQVLSNPAVDEKHAERIFYINGGNLTVFPSPANEQLTVHYIPTKSGVLTLQLMSAQGQVVAPIVHAAVEEGGERKFYFDVTNLTNGTYIVRAEQNSAILIRRATVLH